MQGDHAVIGGTVGAVAIVKDANFTMDQITPTTSPSPDPPTIRRATSQDIAAIGEIERLSFVHAGERFSERKVRHLIHNRRSVAAVAESGGHVLGWSVGFSWTRGPVPWGRVYALAVHPGSRGLRLGPRLLDYLIGKLRGRGAGPIFLEVRTDNHAAIRLYEKSGFGPCATLDHFYGPGIPAIRMKLPLDGL